MKKFQTLKWATAGVAGAAIAFAAGMGPASAQDDVLVGLITKTDNNPFFVKMREGAQSKADELGVKFQAFAGKFDGDNDGQVAAVETLIAAGAKGILITPSDTVGIVPTIQKARDASMPKDNIERATPAFWSLRSTRRSIRSIPLTRRSPPTTSALVS